MGKVGTQQLTEELAEKLNSSGSIEDVGEYFESSDVEGALQEVGEALHGARTSLRASVQSLLGQ